MGNPFKALGGLLGGGKAPKVSTEPVQAVQQDKAEANVARRSLYNTEGGILGMNLNPDSVQQRQTLLGN